MRRFSRTRLREILVQDLDIRWGKTVKDLSRTRSTRR